MSREDGGSGADKARELERIQRQAQIDGRDDEADRVTDLLAIHDLRTGKLDRPEAS